MKWIAIVSIWYLAMGMAFAPAAESDYRKRCRIRAVPESNLKAWIYFALVLFFWPIWISYQELMAIKNRRPR